MFDWVCYVTGNCFIYQFSQIHILSYMLEWMRYTISYPDRLYKFENILILCSLLSSKRHMMCRISYLTYHSLLVRHIYANGCTTQYHISQYKRWVSDRLYMIICTTVINKDAYDFISHTLLQIIRFLYMLRIIIHHHPPPCFYLPLHLLPSLPLLPMHAEMAVQHFNLMIRESRTSNMVSM